MLKGRVVRIREKDEDDSKGRWILGLTKVSSLSLTLWGNQSAEATWNLTSAFVFTGEGTFAERSNVIIDQTTYICSRSVHQDHCSCCMLRSASLRMNNAV